MLSLLSLNIWGGKLRSQLMGFLRIWDDYDVYCFQEVYSSPHPKLLFRNMYANIFEQLSEVLPDHQGYFVSYMDGHDITRPVDFPLQQGVALFVRKKITVEEQGALPVVCEEYTTPTSKATMDIKLQYVQLKKDAEQVKIMHFQGLWQPHERCDSDKRIQQTDVLNAHLQSSAIPTILCGDFNLLPHTVSLQTLDSSMKNLVQHNRIHTTRTIYASRDERHSDYIFSSETIAVKKFLVLSDLVSDHSPLYLECTCT